MASQDKHDDERFSGTCPTCGQEFQRDEIERLRGALIRLGSMEAFTPGGVVDPVRDAELLARVDYARAAVK